jgi:hypothetical protein
MKGERDMDDLAKKLLYNDAVTPPDAVWARLEGQLPNQGERLLPLFFVRMIGLVTMVLALGAGLWWFLDTAPGDGIPEKIQEAPPQSENQTSKTGTILQADRSTEKSDKTSEEEKPKPSALSNRDVAQIPDGKSPSVAQPLPSATALESAPALGPKSGANATLDFPSKSQPSQVSNDVSTSATSASAASAFRGTDSAFALPEDMELWSPTNSEMAPASLMVPMLPFAPPTGRVSPELRDRMADIDYGPRPMPGWFVGAFADLRSTSIRISSAQDAASQLVDSLVKAENPASNIGAGIQFGYHITPKWRISSGLAYANWCRTTKYPVLFTVSDLYEGALASETTTIPMEQNIISATGTQLVQVDVPSQELTNFAAQIPQGASIAKQLEIEECYRFLHVPLMVEYRHEVGRFGILPGAGLSFEHVLKRTTTLIGSGTNGNNAELIPADIGQRNFISLMASVHVEYQFTEHVFLRTGVNYKSWITPIYESDVIRSAPRLLSIDAGLIYIFDKKAL